MKLPRLRFTTRGLMLAVLVVAVTIWVLYVRRERFVRLARHHNSESYKTGRMVDVGRGVSLHQLDAKGRWHNGLAQKYLYASSHPWLPVAADPPEPR